ncbi:MgtC/SapB family protein [Flavobacterium sp. MC2016-06]|jgi:putative Mg2+ transporter-C (MgtC) family protein|uniref:MgtC/SapB family protein n=1 Tax=Flavobacterium sp. MC2016-06 TaxID=2676308 RepID=UPI0012BB034A|nr:MgtC/SapB family protein [Flavobacterium sp. MC2016-06]MBU3860297.1 MgtC/SapB family protein [Flavobacterium sp. MC2016-06]
MVFDIEILIRFLLALLWGGLVGAEREYHGKAAGFRTTIMISFGACFFTIMSMAIGGSANPDRIASNIVTGIGFLGAGVIFRGDNRISGITTAATIWAVAAVGMGIGAGFYFASACASLSILFILAVLPFLQERIDRLNQSRSFYIRCSITSNAVLLCEEEMKAQHIKHKLMRQVRDGEKLHLTWQLQGKSVNMAAFFDNMFKADYIDFMES